MALLITFLAGISVLAGAQAARAAKDPQRIGRLSISLACGAMIALLFFDLLPDIAGSGGKNSPLTAVLFILAGVAGLKILDFFIPDHEDTEANHDRENSEHIGMMSALAVILHNIVEGMTVCSLSLTSLSQGALFAFGIALHNIPMGMLIYSAISDRRRRTKAVILSVVSLSTVVGGVLMILVSGYLNERLINALVCVAAGMIIYIAFLELLPHVLRTRPLRPALLGVLAGFALVFVSCLIAG